MGLTLWRVGVACAALIPTTFLLVFFVWPVVTLLGTGLLTDGALRFGETLQVLQESRTWNVIRQTVVQAVSGTLVSLLIGIPTAYCLYRLRFRGQALVRGLLTVPFVLPTVVVAAAFQSLFGETGLLGALGLDRSFTMIVCALAFFNVTVIMRVVGGFWATLDDRQEQAARMLGANPLRTFSTITFPRLLPSILSAAALSFLFCSTAFGIVLILGGREFSNIETEIYRLTMQFLDLKGASVLALVQAVMVILALVVSARLRRRGGNPQGITVDRVSRTVRLPKATVRHTPVLLFTGASILLLHVLPLASLLLRSLRRTDGSFTFDHYRFLWDPPLNSPLRSTVVQALGTSLVFAIIAATLSMILGWCIALALSRRGNTRAEKLGRTGLETLVMLPLGVSAVTVGLGLLLTMHQPFGIGIDLRTSSTLIPIAQTLIALPLVVRTMLPVLQSIDERQRHAATMLGASPARVFRTIEAPALGRTVGLSLGFAFATSLGEFGATSFLVRGGEETLPIVIAQLIGHQAPESYGTGLAAAILLGTVTTIVMLIAEGWRVTEHAGEW